MEFNELMSLAGDWAAGIKLKDAKLKSGSNELVVSLYSDKPVERDEKEVLEALLAEQFPSYEIELFFDAPQFSTPVKRQIKEPDDVKKTEQKKKAKPDKENRGAMFYGKRPDSARQCSIAELKSDKGFYAIEGRLLSYKVQALPKSPGRFLLLIALTDFTGTIGAKVFISEKAVQKAEKALEKALKEEGRVRLYGNGEIDKFSNEMCFFFRAGEKLKQNQRKDEHELKRVELHLHTKMSAMDALTDVSAVVATAARFGHKALAITDHGVVQAFPEAYKAGAKHGVKILYGMEGYLVADADPIPADNDYVVVDLETTGLEKEKCSIIEIGAVKIVKGEIADRFSSFLELNMPLPEVIKNLTGITDDMLEYAPRPEHALRDFFEFARGSVLVAHNASFDMGFLRFHADKYGLEFKFRYVDTLMLSRYLLFGMKSHKLGKVCEHLNIPLVNHHRAVDDAEATAQVFLKLLKKIKELGVESVPANLLSDKNKKYNHVVLLAKTQQGMKNLYRLVSAGHINFFHKKPLLPKYLLNLFREGILVGSACEQGELYQAMLAKSDDDELRRIADWYDYLEIQPMSNNAFLIRENMVSGEDELKENNRRIIDLAKKLGKPVVATGDVHFLEPEDSVFRAVLMSEMGYKDAMEQAGLYFKTTDEMLEEFAYLGEEDALEVVVNAPNAIADEICELKPYPDGTFAPKIEGAEQDLKQMTLTRATELYGEPLPPTVKKRLDKELKSIIDNGFASLYLTAQRLVKKSLEDGYLVGSRGSVGSSLVATMAGITEVNPLPPHYLCECGFSDFDIDKSLYACGADMPERLCPNCGMPLIKEGFDIPFEVFLGFKGDKTPDIDLNFSGEYQPVAHKFTEEMFGEGHAFRAGTISGIKNKTAFGFVMKYLEKREGVETDQDESSKQKDISRFNKLEIERLCAGCLGVKRTTGQHPGGIVVLPKERDILEFTPIQYPADDKKKETITTHFDFHALDDRLVKLDILGHDDPTALRMLHDMTGIDPRSIPLNDPDTLLLYSSAKGLNIDLSALKDCDVGSLGLPEFGTSFVRQLLMDTRPTTLEELVRIAGLSHGTDVWLNNAQSIVKDGTASLREVICTRDDIMNSLIARGCDPSKSFRIMETVRKGKGITADMEQTMKDSDTPEWFITSCKKIKYMFPRAHAVAYVLMSFRVAYYKYHYPEAFYAAYFTVRADAFDILRARGGAQAVLSNIEQINALGKNASNMESELLTILEVVYEMNLRGIELLPVDLYASDAKKFKLEEGGIRPPLNSVPSVGANAAESIAKKAQTERFNTIDEFQTKTKANSAVVCALKEAGCFGDMPQNGQLSFFG